MTEICPYPTCDQVLPAGAALLLRRCGVGHPVVSCGVCDMGNRLSATYCRRCAAPVSVPEPELGDTGATGCFVSMSGNFRRPPLASAGACYAVTTGGILQEVMLGKGADSRALAAVAPGIASNRGMVVDLPRLGESRAGATFLGVHPGGVQAVILATGAVHELHAGATIAVNDANAGSFFSGLAANSSLFAFAERTGDAQITLTLRSFSRDAVAEQVLTLPGADAIGPILSREKIALCTAGAVGVYDLNSKQASTGNLPRGFEPMLTRRQGGVNITPGTIPLTVDDDQTVYVAGYQAGVSGLLRLQISSGVSSFEPLGRDASLTSNLDGSLSVAAEGEIRVFGADGSPFERERLQFAMPVTCHAGWSISFGEEQQRGLHRMVVSRRRGSRRSQLVFEDSACNENTCAAPLISGLGIAVPYFCPTSQGEYGLKIAIWDQSETHLSSTHYS